MSSRSVSKTRFAGSGSGARTGLISAVPAGKPAGLNGAAVKDDVVRFRRRPLLNAPAPTDRFIVVTVTARANELEALDHTLRDVDGDARRSGSVGVARERDRDRGGEFVHAHSGADGLPAPEELVAARADVARDQVDVLRGVAAPEERGDGHRPRQGQQSGPGTDRPARACSQSTVACPSRRSRSSFAFEI